MGEPVSRIPSLVEQVLPALGPDNRRSLGHWIEVAKDNPARLQDLKQDVESIVTLVASIAEPFHASFFADYTGLVDHLAERSNPFDLLLLRTYRISRNYADRKWVSLCFRKLSIRLSNLKREIDSLQEPGRTKFFFPSQIGNRIEPILVCHGKVEHTLKSLISSSRFQAFLDDRHGGQISASEVTSLSTQVRRVGNDLKQWRHDTEVHRARLQSLTEDLESATTHLASLSETLKHPDAPRIYQTLFEKTPLDCISENLDPAEALRIHEVLQRTTSLRKKLTILRNDIDNLNASRTKYLLSDSEVRRKMEPLHKRHDQILYDLEELVSDRQVKPLLNPRPSVQSEDAFRHVVNVPTNPQGVVLDFHTMDASGRPITNEGRLRYAVFDAGSPKIITVCGGGGSGKTVALRALGWLSETRAVFTGGVLYTSIGMDGSLRSLVQSISDIVRQAGGIPLAREISGNSMFQHAVSKAGEWFSHSPCLFLIDDIWAVNNITSSHVAHLVALAAHRLSRVVYATRDISITSGDTVEFQASGSLDASAQAVLLSCAALEHPTGTEALEAFHSILDRCHGHPLALAISGCAVRQLAVLRYGEDPEMAWESYWRRIQDHMVSPTHDSQIVRGVIISLDLLDEENPQFKLREKFASLSILRKNQNLPFLVAHRLWGLPGPDTLTVIDLLKRFSIISVFESTRALSMHDLLLDVSRALAREDGSSFQWTNTLIESYMKDCSSEGSHPSDDTSDDEALSTSESSDVQNVTCCVPCTRACILRYLLCCATCTGTCADRVSMSDESSGRSQDVSPSANASGMERFRDCWLKVKDDGYIFRNICWLLTQGGFRDHIQWLVCNPEWIIGQLTKNGGRQVAEDIDFAIEIISNGDQTVEPDEKEIVKFLRLLQHAVFMAANHVRESEWDGTPWFQLHGRLVHLETGNSAAGDFLKGLAERAPRPFLRPSPGCLQAAGGSLRLVIDVIGKYLCHVLVDSKVLTCYAYDDDIFIVRHNISGGKQITRSTQSAPEIVLRHVGGKSSFSCAQFTESGRRLAVGLDSGIIVCRLDPEVDGLQSEEARRIGQASSSKDQQTSPSTLPGESEQYSSPYRVDSIPLGVVVTALSFSIDGDLIVSGSQDGTVCVSDFGDAGWNTVKLRGNMEFVTSVAMSRDGRRVVSGFLDGHVRVWNKEEHGWSGMVVLEPTRYVTKVAISGDGRRLVSASRDGVRVMDDDGPKWRSVVLAENLQNVASVAISLNGGRVVTGSIDGTVGVWQDNIEWVNKVLGRHKESVTSVFVSGDETSVVSGSLDGSVHVWDAEQVEWTAEKMRGHTDLVTSVTLSENGKRLVSGSRDRTVRVWDWNGKRWTSAMLDGHTSDVLSVAISEDGRQGKSKDAKRTLVSGSRDRTVRVWDWNGKRWTSAVLDGHTSDVLSVAISEDGSQVKAKDDKGVVIVWEKQKGGVWDRVKVKPGMEMEEDAKAVPVRWPRYLDVEIIDEVVAPLGMETYKTAFGFFIKLGAPPFLAQIDVLWD